MNPRFPTPSSTYRQTQATRVFPKMATQSVYVGLCTSDSCVLGDVSGLLPASAAPHLFHYTHGRHSQSRCNLRRKSRRVDQQDQPSRIEDVRAWLRPGRPGGWPGGPSRYRMSLAEKINSKSVGMCGAVACLRAFLFPSRGRRPHSGADLCSSSSPAFRLRCIAEGRDGGYAATCIYVSLFEVIVSGGRDHLRRLS